MKRNFIVGVFGGLIGLAMLLMLLSAAGVVGARAIQSQSDAARTQDVSAATPLTSTFTYQGQLQSGGKPISATCNFQFGLWDTLNGGNQIGITQTVSSLGVNNGYFTAPLNSGNEFGVSVFTGEARWLQIAVRCPAGSGNFATLTPRQSITAAPYSLFSTSTGALQGRSITTTAPGTGQVLKWNGGTWSPADDAIGSAGSGWALTGNAGTNASTNFVGTMDNVMLTLRVSNTVGWRLVPSGANTPNVIGGYSGNSVTSGVYGATIGGGGASGNLNRVTDDYGVVGGGANNTAGSRLTRQPDC